MPWTSQQGGDEAMKLQSRWLVLALIGVAILGAALWIGWARPIGGSPASPTAPPAAARTAPPATETSEMLKMARTAFLACSAPAVPSDIPDGATATREQMIDAHATVKAFDQATTIYTQCVDKTAYQASVQFKAVATSADTEALGRLQTQLHNAAIDRDQALANRFNVQLRRFKARAPK